MSSLSIAEQPACALASSVNTAYEGSNPAWIAHLNASAAIRAKFNNVSGISAGDSAGWNTSWDQ